MRWGRAIVIALIALTASVGEGRALAHPPPMGTGLWWLPPVVGQGQTGGGGAGGGAGERLVIRTPRGFLFASSQGADPRLLCNAAIGVLDGETSSFEQVDGTTLFIATYDKGLVTATTDACQWDPIAGVTTKPAFDVVAAGPTAAYAVGGTSHEGQHFWVGRAGESGGAFASWSALANSDTPYTSVRVAPSDPARVYLTGIDLTATGEAIHRIGVSDDGGKTVVDRLISLGPHDLQARVLAVDPLHSAHVYVHVESNSAELPERLLSSQDSGQSFTAGPTVHDLQGFAQSDDGQRVWVGGREGLFRSDDGGVSFSSVTVGKLSVVTCLAFHQGRLYGCGVLDNQIVVAVSEDNGETFGKVLSFADVKSALACPGLAPGRAPANVCAEALAHWRAEVGPPDPAPDSPGAGGVRGAGGVDGSGSPDGGVGGVADIGGRGGSSPGPHLPAGSSGCAVGSGSAAPVRAAPLVTTVLATTVLAFGRRRRRKGS